MSGRSYRSIQTALTVMRRAAMRRARTAALRVAAGRMRVARTNARLRNVARAAARLRRRRRGIRGTTVRAWARSRLASRFRSGGFL